MTRAGLKLLLLIGIVFLLRRAVAASSSDGDRNTVSQNTSLLVTNVAQLRSLSRADLNRGRPISLIGTVTLVDNERRRLVLQDDTGAVMWYSDKPIDPALAGRMIRIACPDARTYATTFPDFPY